MRALGKVFYQPARVARYTASLSSFSPLLEPVGQPLGAPPTAGRVAARTQQEAGTADRRPRFVLATRVVLAECSAACSVREASRRVLAFLVRASPPLIGPSGRSRPSPTPGDQNVLKAIELSDEDDRKRYRERRWCNVRRPHCSCCRWVI